MCLRDNFTDGNGTPLENHVPDGEGGQPFRWISGGNPSFDFPARILNDAVDATDASPRYNYFSDAGGGLDVVEADMVVLEPVTRQQEVLLYLRATPDSGFSNGVALRLIIFDDGSTEIDLHRPGGPVVWVVSSEPWLPGTYRLRLEIVAGEVVNFYVGDQLRLSSADGAEPLGAGTVGIGGFRLGGPAQVQITSFSAGAPTADTLVVTCTPAPVSRGENVKCTATPQTPGANVTVTKWTFTSADLPNPITLASSDTIWSGLAAVSGNVTAEGTVNGLQQSGTGLLTVKARDWSTEQATYSWGEVPSDLPLRPDSLGKLGDTRHFTGVDLPPEKYVQIENGPNAGVFYVLKVPLAARGDIRVNRGALKRNSAFYRIQPKRRPSPSECSQADVEPFVPVIERHEGRSLELNSHTYLYKQKLNERAGNATEGLVALNDLTALLDTAAAAGQAVFDSALANSRRADKAFRPEYCLFRYF